MRSQKIIMSNEKNCKSRSAVKIFKSAALSGMEFISSVKPLNKLFIFSKRFAFFVFIF